MNKDLNLKLADVLNESIVSERSVGGGCIADSSIITTASGISYFLKTNCEKGVFKCEANSLKELAGSAVIKIPEVIAVDDDFLLLENISSGQRRKDFFSHFGKQLALMHKVQKAKYGFYEDNYIGASIQKNTYSLSWTDFYFTNRLLFQYKLFEHKGNVTSELKSKFSKLEDKIQDILGDVNEPPVLLHGDLWGGNYLVDNVGNPVLIDPAVYYGHRETDLAMTKLFGGFTKEFYEAYNEINPLTEGYAYRENIYILYHVMNHLNLFGSGYYQQTLDLMNYYL